MSVYEAALLFALFLGQFFFPGTHTLFTIIYLVLGVIFLFIHRQHLFAAGRRVMTAASGQ